jgi:hypothetical protein
VSSKNLEKVIQRAISDAAFRRQLQASPEAALRGFKLTDNEVAALRSGDAGKLISLGIDQRMSKAFTVGGTMALNAASRAAIDGGLAVGASALADTDAGRMGSALIPGNPNLSNADIDPGNVATSADTDSATGFVTRVRDIEPASVGDPANPDPSDPTSELTARHLATGSDTTSELTAQHLAATDAGTMSSALRDTEPFDSRGVSDPTSELTAQHLAATDAGTMSSALRDTEPFDSRGVSDPTSELTAQHLATGSDTTSELTAQHLAAADAGTMSSALRDTEPFDSRGVSDPTSELTAQHLAATDAAGGVTRINDSEPFDLRGAVAGPDAAGGGTSAFDPDSPEAYAPSFHTGGQDAFLSTDEAAQYAASGTGVDQAALDAAQAEALNTDASVPMPEHGGGDAIGNTGTNDPQISA